MWPDASRGSRFLGDVSEISPSALEKEDLSKWQGAYHSIQPPAPSLHLNRLWSAPIRSTGSPATPSSWRRLPSARRLPRRAPTP